MVMNGRSGSTGNEEDYKFTGKERDTETGLDYFGARYYDSKIGRWLSVDPLADKSPGVSPYAYSLNNPLNYVDPDGKFPLLTRLAQWLSSPNGQRVVQKVNRFGKNLASRSYWNREWKGFSQKVQNLPSRISNDASRVFNSAKNLLSSSSNRVINTTGRQLQRKFNHANDFGISGNYNKENATKFGEAITKHINTSGVKVIEGTYRGDKVTHYFNPKTKLNVIVNPDGNFVSGWKLGKEQIENVLKHGGLN